MPRDARPQAARFLTMYVFEQGPKNFRCTNLCSENLELHVFLDILPFVLLSKSSCTNLSYTTFSIHQKTCISRPYCKLNNSTSASKDLFGALSEYSNFKNNSCFEFTRPTSVGAYALIIEDVCQFTGIERMFPVKVYFIDACQ